MKNAILKAMKKRSFWIGLFALLSGAGVTVSPIAKMVITEIGIEVATDESKPVEGGE